MAVGTIAFFKEKRCNILPHYRILGVITDSSNGKETPIIIDEHDKKYEGPVEAMGSLWKIGNQCFTHERYEVEKPESVASIDKYILGSTKKSESLFYATRTDGKPTIVKTDLSEDAPHFSLLGKNFEVVPMDFRGTLFETWMKKHEPGKNMSEPDDWILFRDINGYGLMHLPTRHRLKVIHSCGSGSRRKAMEKLPEPDEYGIVEYLTYDSFRDPPKFFNDPEFGPCMRIDDWQADEETMSCHCRLAIVMYWVSPETGRPEPDVDYTVIEQTKKSPIQKIADILSDIFFIIAFPFILLFGLLAYPIALLVRKIKG